jgi:hypothetical protein
MATLSGLKEMNENPETKREDRSGEAETAQGQSEENGGLPGCCKSGNTRFKLLERLLEHPPPPKTRPCIDFRSFRAAGSC